MRLTSRALRNTRTSMFVCWFCLTRVTDFAKNEGLLVIQLISFNWDWKDWDNLASNLPTVIDSHFDNSHFENKTAFQKKKRKKKKLKWRSLVWQFETLTHFNCIVLFSLLTSSIETMKNLLFGSVIPTWNQFKPTEWHNGFKKSCCKFVKQTASWSCLIKKSLDLL